MYFSSWKWVFWPVLLNSFHLKIGLQFCMEGQMTVSITAHNDVFHIKNVIKCPIKTIGYLTSYSK